MHSPLYYYGLVLPLLLLLSSQSTSALKVLPFGDSITGWPGCWRHLLSASHPQLTFVGTQSSSLTNCPSPAYPDVGSAAHDGHPGIRITDQLLTQDWLSDALDTNPDLVLWHWGTNDLLHEPRKSANEILDAYDEVLAKFHGDKTRVLVARIIPCSECGKRRVNNLDQGIDGWLQERNSSGEWKGRLWGVDMNTGYGGQWTRDGTHPNRRGEEEMAKRWTEGLRGMGIFPGGEEGEEEVKKDPEEKADSEAEPNSSSSSTSTSTSSTSTSTSTSAPTSILKSKSKSKPTSKPKQTNDANRDISVADNNQKGPAAPETDGNGTTDVKSLASKSSDTPESMPAPVLAVANATKSTTSDSSSASAKATSSTDNESAGSRPETWTGDGWTLAISIGAGIFFFSRCI